MSEGEGFDGGNRMRVTAYFMNEQERAVAREHLRDAQFTPSFGVGTASQLDVRRLRNAGLVVQVVDSEQTRSASLRLSPDEPRPSAKTRLQRSVLDSARPLNERLATAHAAGLEISVGPSAGAGFPTALQDNTTYLTSFSGPLLSAHRAELSEKGFVVLDGMGDNTVTARMPADQVESVGSLPFVQSLRPFDDEDTLALQFNEEFRGGAPIAEKEVWDVKLHSAGDLDHVEGWLETKSVSIVGTGIRKIRISLMDDPAVMREIARLPQVQQVERFIPPRLWNDHACAILGVGASSITNRSLNGNGEIVAIADTGIDLNHPDLANRVITSVGLGRPGHVDDPNGHGTHVSGSVAGDGTSSAGAIKGAAPGARIYFQSLLDANGGLGGLPVDLADLFRPPYDAGVRIHSNSWGSATQSMYTVNADEVDGFVRANPDMLIVLAGGNEGTAVDPVNAVAGSVDWLSIGSPATSKNALTVGACRTDRADGPSAGRTWSNAWPLQFPNDPIASEAVAGDPESMAAFSSRGPCDDHRIKPDLVAPGTDILSTRSSTAPDNHFWGLDAARPAYAFMGGTSMATPLVSGCAALVRQYYRDLGHMPSAALLRATLINGTRWLTGADANASTAPGATAPSANYDQGFGRLDLAMSLPGPDLSYFVDDWSDDNRALGSTGDYRRFRVEIGEGTYLRICMAYTDVPARALQNNLNLIVQPANGGAKLLGNAQLNNALGPLDVNNNVEVIRLFPPIPGSYIVQVTASNLLQPLQHFALVVTSDALVSASEIG